MMRALDADEGPSLTFQSTLNFAAVRKHLHVPDEFGRALY